MSNKISISSSLPFADWMPFDSTNSRLAGETFRRKSSKAQYCYCIRSIHSSEHLFWKISSRKCANMDRLTSRGKLLAPLGDATQELVEGVRKLPYAVVEAVPRRSSRAGCRACPKRRASAWRQRHPIPELARSGFPMIAKRIQGCGRHGVHGVRADKRIDVISVRQAILFRAGRRPKQTLRPRALGGQCPPARRREQHHVSTIRQFGGGDGDLVSHPMNECLVGICLLSELLVDRQIDAAQEEARD